MSGVGQVHSRAGSRQVQAGPHVRGVHVGGRECGVGLGRGGGRNQG